MPTLSSNLEEMVEHTIIEQPVQFKWFSWQLNSIAQTDYAGHIDVKTFDMINVDPKNE